MFEGEKWYEYLEEGQRDLVKQAYDLLKESGIRNQKLGREKFHDYSFVVFPMAKAYEGFLKKWFWDRGLIDRQTYEGDRFRIGKALNPDLPEKYRGRWWLYGTLVEGCGEQTSRQLWQAWRECRNRLFHFFPKHRHFISIDEAGEKLAQLKQAMELAFECGLTRG